MHPVSGPLRLGFLAIALCLAAGCAQPVRSGTSTTENQVPGFLPADHWQASSKYKTAGIASTDHGAALMLAFGRDGKPTPLLVSPQRKLSIDAGYWPVTIVLDRKITFIQNWLAVESGYGINEKDPGFRTVIETLQKHQSVEFVLNR